MWEEGYVADPATFAMMHTQAVVILEGGPLRRVEGALDRESIRRRIEVATASLRESRSRLMRSTLGLTPPAWVPDATFDIDRHVRFSDDVLSVTSANLPRLTGLTRGALSLRHPLWRMTLTELDDGDVALGVVMHHVVGDALFTLRMLSALTAKTVDHDVRIPIAAATVGRPPRMGGELPWLALRAWAAAQPSLRAGWRAYWSTPLGRRVRRAGGRMLRPLRTARAHSRGDGFASLPARHADFRTMSRADVSRAASDLGCTMSDLLIASVIRSAPGTDREVGLRIPIAVRRTTTDGARNSVVDLEVRGLRDRSPRELAAAVRSQLPARPGDAPAPAGHSGTPRPIGYVTLIPWLSQPRYFGAARVKEIIAFPTGLASDELSTQAIMYDDKVTFVATAQRRTDVSSIADRLLLGLTDPDDGLVAVGVESAVS